MWTTWYHRRYWLVGLLILAYMRGQLNRFNLKNTYPRGLAHGFPSRRGSIPPKGVTHFRTANGTWNDLCNPKEGAAGTRFLRNVTNGAISRALDKDAMTPDPRKVSMLLLTRENGAQEVSLPEHAGHCLDQLPEPRLDPPRRAPSADTYVIPLADNDPIRAATG